MKLSARDAAAYFKAPDKDAAGILIYGADAMRVALKRQDVIAALVGPSGEEEMRLTRLSGADLRKDGAALLDGIKAQGFFPGPRVVFVEEAGDGLAKLFAAALADWQPGDAQIVATAGALPARSALRKTFEGDGRAYAAGVYDDPPSRAEIEAELKRAGIADIGREAMADLTALSRALDPGDFRQTLEKLALYKLGDATPLDSADVDACAPQSTEGAVDDALHIVAEARLGELGPMLRKLSAQGIAPVTLCIGATRHFRALHGAMSNPGGPEAGIARMRPPIFGPRRDRMVRQARSWGVARLEQALEILLDTDLQLRSAAQTAPPGAVIERTLIRLAMLGQTR